MQSGKFIKAGVWLMILFNICLSLGAVWSFQRMNPEIRQIYAHNVISLDACEKMLLALTGDTVDLQAFDQALRLAEANISEAGEKEVVQKIRLLLGQQPENHNHLRRQLTQEIVKLAQFNKNAISNSARHAQQMRQAGAWGIVFLTLLFFLLALALEQRLRRNLLAPLQEISEVLQANLQGDHFRRCNLPEASPEVRKLLQSINHLLDRRP